MIWALPFWKPTPTQYEKLDALLTTPLRTALALPLCTSRAAIFVEYGTADMKRTRQQQILAYAARLHQSSMQDHLAKKLMEQQVARHTTRAVLDTSAHIPLPWWAELYEIEEEWQCSHTSHTPQQLKQMMVRRQLQHYHSSLPSSWPPRPGLRAIKLQPGVSHYIYHDTKNIAVLRARLRFDINGLQLGVVATRVATAQLIQQRRQSDDRDDALSPPDAVDPSDARQRRRCQLCGLDDADSRRHLLVHCPALHDTRSEVELDMQSSVIEQPGYGFRHRLRVSSYECEIRQASERFLLGELNCLSAVLKVLNDPPEMTTGVVVNAPELGSFSHVAGLPCRERT
jgi:hypothetical protein